MIPLLNSSTSQNIKQISYPSHTYRLTDNSVEGHVSGMDALKQSIYHDLNIERYAYPIYESNYGIQLEQFKGRSFAFFKSLIETVLREGLTQDDRITDVVVTSVTQPKTDAASVEFDVYSTLGTLEGMEVAVNV